MSGEKQSADWLLSPAFCDPLAWTMRAACQHSQAAQCLAGAAPLSF